MTFLPKKNPRKAFYGFILFSLWPGMAFGSSQVLTLTENKRLEANISADMMNRIAVTNDRIESVFGDDETFVTQADERTGQIFIKPTPEHAAHPLSITITTENGLTQDLILNPVGSKASTIILKTSQPVQGSSSPQEALLPGFSKHSETEQEQWITLMKRAVLGELPELDEKHTVKARSCLDLQSKHEKDFQANAFIVQMWSLKNTSQISQELQEKNFYQPGDIAISFQKRRLEPHETTFIYVLRTV